MDLDKLIGQMVNIQRPPMTPEEEDRHERWRFEVARAGFKGDDNDAKYANALIDLVEHAYNLFSHESEYVGMETSQSLHDAVGSTPLELHKTLDKIVKMSVVRMSALGIDPPPHPDDISKKTSVPYVPPMSEAG